MLSSKKTLFRNLDFLRILLALSVANFHIVFAHGFDKFGLADIYRYFSDGHMAVMCFFIIAFFFVCMYTTSEQSIPKFITKKYFRLAPLVIFTTILFFILSKFGFWGFNFAANIEQILLIHDWAGTTRWAQTVHPGWWLSQYMLISIFYLGLIKTFDKKYIPFIIGFFGIFGLRMLLTTPLSDSFLYADMGKAIFSLSVAYFLSLAYKSYSSLPPPQATKSKNCQHVRLYAGH